ncbi:hypothetical protein HG531_001780 [Fusarium graminearum]|nr:hypothetical protein HG531_001780 [Fusarium graminearum]
MHQSLPFLIKEGHRRPVTSQLITEFIIMLEPLRRVSEIETVLLLESGIRHVENSQLLILNDHSIETVFAIKELNNVAQRITNSTIVARRKVFKSLDQSSLNVTSFSSLDRSINETFSTSHGVEEKLARGKTTQSLKLVGSSHRRQASDLGLLIVNVRLNLGDGHRIGNRVTDTNTESHGTLGSQLIVADMHNTARRSTNTLLCKKAIHQLTGLNQETLVLKRGTFARVGTVENGNLLRDNHADELLTSPARAGLVNSWLGNDTIPVRDPKHAVHDLLLGEENISTAHLVGSSERVLDNTHEGAVLLGRYNVERD